MEDSSRQLERPEIKTVYGVPHQHFGKVVAVWQYWTKIEDGQTVTAKKTVDRTPQSLWIRPFRL